MPRSRNRYEAERTEWQLRQQQEEEEIQALEQHQRYRSSEHIWRVRSPDEAVDELIAAVNAEACRKCPA